MAAYSHIAIKYGTDNTAWHLWQYLSIIAWYTAGVVLGIHNPSWSWWAFGELAAAGGVAIAIYVWVLHYLNARYDRRLRDAVIAMLKLTQSN
jgi:type IV secretory pathway TraG/TraD family ATPase VirD4